MQNEKRAVVLLSGGLDSATVLGIAAERGFAVAALSFDYGQRHAREVACAGALARHYRVLRHETMKIDLRAFGGSALTADIAVPKDGLGKKQEAGSQKQEQIPVTYVPARNTVFLSLAVGLAEVWGAMDIFIGVNAIDYSGYPDCRPEFIEAFERVANLGTKAGVEAGARGRGDKERGRQGDKETRRGGQGEEGEGSGGGGGGGGFRIHAPLIRMTKGEIIREGLRLGVPYELTHSCYDPSAAGLSCGHCDSCLLRLAGFKEAGVRDPVGYV